MPTVKQGIEKLRAWERQGKGHLHLPHLVLIEETVKEKIQNNPDEKGRRKTKIAWESGDPDVYANFHKERERYMEAAGHNPVLATEAMLMALKGQPDDMIRAFVNALVEPRNPLVPKAIIPGGQP